MHAHDAIIARGVSSQLTLLYLQDGICKVYNVCTYESYKR